MSQNFLQIQKEYLQKVWGRESKELEEFLPASFKGGYFYFQAFGEPCELYPQEILSNATDFLPVAGLADTAEYTAKKIIQLVTEVASERAGGLK